VSPGLRTSETAAQWDREARYTWVLLWGYLDDYGRGVNNAKVIAADCYPLDDDVTTQMMKDWLRLYETAGSTCHYEFEGKQYLHVLNWSDHQKPQHPSKPRIVPCPEHEIGAHRTWLEVRAAEHAKVSGNPHEGLVRVSPTSRGGGEVSLEMSDGDEGGSSSGAAPTTPPLYPDRCASHGNVAAPGNCGNCADVRKANARQHLTVVTAFERPDWCGHCDEHTRQRETPFGVIRCPECHPLADEEAS
jgi:hypothetical protein